jgi:propanol-preferring alcohol dehydrogenase
LLRSRWETLCEQQENSGYSVNGTFAEYAVAPAAFATPVPETISSRDGAPLTCAGVTTYKATKVARVALAETVAIFGIGGLGHLALQYARDRRGVRHRCRRRGAQARDGDRARRRSRRQRPHE